jgi:hypothetical protein
LKCFSALALALRSRAEYPLKAGHLVVSTT